MIGVVLAASLLRFFTPFGTIDVSLDDARAPKSSAAFRTCALGPHGHGWTIYRVVRPGNQSKGRNFQVIQGGLNATKNPYPNVPLESTRVTGLHNTAGTLGMPRDAAPNTGSACDFYINVTDDRVLDAEHTKDGYGYAVFGSVVRGMDVVKKILMLPAAGERGQYLVHKVTITHIEEVP